MSPRRKRNKSIAQAANVTFELHTLGWEAFQNLCYHVAREILGQTVTVFSPTKDVGQDGAFQGVWQTKKQEVFSGRLVIQCKHTSKRDAHLGLGELNDEIMKAAKLAANGLAQTYLLITNARVSGEADKNIREAFGKIKGIEYFDLYGSEWITQQILDSKRLRAFVPRIYGLGDLSQILDERVYRQADEILNTWKENLAKFVPTEAHSKSVKALLEEGFVLLLGDPMAGKSTIAASLALAAADQWQCIPVFVTKPDDFKAHWNPDEPKQFFWVDDAFGQTQLDSSATEGWNRLFPHLNAALKSGAKILFTSRTYIYNSAHHELKEAAFPQIKNSRVTIHVENLTLVEKERILYNHIRLGNQPADFRKAIKKFLPAIAANGKFFPEVAKRLGDSFFTKNLILHEEYLKRFVEEPKEFLCDIINQLNRKCFAALSLLFMRGGRIAMPPHIDHNETEAMSLLGANLADLVESLSSLEGSLVSQAFEGGERFWKFRHPSIRDAMAILIARRAELIDIYLGGVKVSELLREVVCGDVDIPGAKVHIPSNRFSNVISKLRGVEGDQWQWSYDLFPFLASRCSLDFLAMWAKICPDDVEKVITAYAMWNYSYCLVLARLHRLGLLPEDHRRQYLQRAMREVLDSGESMCLSEDLKDLMTTQEYESLLVEVKDDFISRLDEKIDNLESQYSDHDEDPSDYFDSLRSNLMNLQEFFEDPETIKTLEHADWLIDNAVERLREENEEREKKKKLKQQEEEEAEAMEDEALEAMVKEYEQEQMGNIAQTKKTIESMGSRPQIPNVPRDIFDDVDN